MKTLSLFLLLSCTFLQSKAQPGIAHITSSNIHQVTSLQLSITNDVYLVIELNESSSLVIHGETMSFYPVNEVRKIKLASYKPGDYTLVILGADRRKITEIKMHLKQ